MEESHFNALSLSFLVRKMREQHRHVTQLPQEAVLAPSTQSARSKCQHPGDMWDHCGSCRLHPETPAFLLVCGTVFHTLASLKVI